MMPRTLVRLVLSLGGIVAALGVAEVSMRHFGAQLLGPAPGALDVPDDDPNWDGLDEARMRGRITDPDFGVRPPVGSGGRDEFGALENGWPRAKRPGVERVLIVGDSVAERGLFVQALAEAYADEGSPGEEREWWNTGVSGFGSGQEALFYERFGRGIDADHVVLLFHPNDFQATPVVYQDERGRLVTYQPHRRSLRPHPWLLRHSHLYRAYLHWRLDGDDPPGLVDEVRRALARFADLTREEGAAFSVVLLPTFEVDLSVVDPTVREQAIALFDELELRWFDLLPTLERALADGIDPQQSPGDYEHPSLAVCRYFAAELRAGGLLEPRRSSD